MANMLSRGMCAIGPVSRSNHFWSLGVSSLTPNVPMLTGERSSTAGPCMHLPYLVNMLPWHGQSALQNTYERIFFIWLA